VQPADISDGWDSEPFILTERNNKLYGRGSTDDKGPVLGWLHAIEAFQNTGTGLPVNLKVRIIILTTHLIYNRINSLFAFSLFLKEWKNLVA